MTRRCPTWRGPTSAAIAAIFATLLGGSTPMPAQALSAAAPQPRAAGDSTDREAQGQRMLAAILALTAPGMDGRGAGTPGGAKARAWIEARLTAIGARPFADGRYTWPFSFTTKAGTTVQGANVVAVCRGTRAEAGTIVVSAHYDHLGVRDGQTYPGADDNASGVAMLLTVAERCVKAPFAHTLLLVAFDAEEQGLQGARAFLRTPPVPAADLVLNVNFDMVSRSDRREIYVAGPGRWPKLAPVLAGVATGAPITVKFGHDTGGGQQDWTQQSDHGVFHDAGIPFVYFGVEDHADYHKPSDTPDKIAADFLDGVARVVLAGLTALDRAPAFK